MSERTELSSMVTLKEQHIQDLEREKGELLRKLMPGAGSQVSVFITFFSVVTVAPRHSA
jgi:hypothetical protein